MPMLSAMRDASIAGPFETPCTSYVSDPTDPHFGKAFYFGLSGSIDWLVDIFQKMAGITLNIHNPAMPDLIVKPTLSNALKGEMTFKRIIHKSIGNGKYKTIPLTVEIKPCGNSAPSVIINGKKQEEAQITSLENIKKIVMKIKM